MWTPDELAQMKQQVEQVTGRLAPVFPDGDRPTCHWGQAENGIYLLFPDNSKRYYPAHLFPQNNSQRSPYFSLWTDFMRDLYALLDHKEWETVVLDFKPHDRNDTLVVEVSPEGISAGNWKAACELAMRTASLGKDQA